MFGIDTRIYEDPVALPYGVEGSLDSLILLSKSDAQDILLLGS
jgi:hypothetical protein